MIAAGEKLRRRRQARCLHSNVPPQLPAQHKDCGPGVLCAVQDDGQFVVVYEHPPRGDLAAVMERFRLGAAEVRGSRTGTKRADMGALAPIWWVAIKALDRQLNLALLHIPQLAGRGRGHSAAAVRPRLHAFARRVPRQHQGALAWSPCLQAE